MPWFTSFQPRDDSELFEGVGVNAFCLLFGGHHRPELTCCEADGLTELLCSPRPPGRQQTRRCPGGSRRERSTSRSRTTFRRRTAGCRLTAGACPTSTRYGTAVEDGFNNYSPKAKWIVGANPLYSQSLRWIIVLINTTNEHSKNKQDNTFCRDLFYLVLLFISGLFVFISLTRQTSNNIPSLRSQS